MNLNVPDYSCSVSTGHSRTMMKQSRWNDDASSSPLDVLSSIQEERRIQMVVDMSFYSHSEWSSSMFALAKTPGDDNDNHPSLSWRMNPDDIWRCLSQIICIWCSEWYTNLISQFGLLFLRDSRDWLVFAHVHGMLLLSTILYYPSSSSPFYWLAACMIDLRYCFKSPFVIMWMMYMSSQLCIGKHIRQTPSPTNRNIPSYPKFDSIFIHIWHLLLFTCLS